MLYGGEGSLTRLSIRALVTAPEGLVLTYSSDIEKYTLPGLRLFADEDATEDNLRQGLGRIGLNDVALQQLDPMNTEVCAASKLEPTHKNKLPGIIYSRWVMWSGKTVESWQPIKYPDTETAPIRVFSLESARNHPGIGDVARTAITSWQQSFVV